VSVGHAIRGEFPIFEHTTYVNSCSQGALSQRVRRAYEEYLEGWDANGAEWAVWVERADAARSAFGRLLQEYPSRTDGLSLTQRRILLAAADGPAPAGRIFRTISQQERRPFLGDTSFFAYLGDLAACEVPLLTAGDGVRLTAAGREVLAGREDHARLNGIDRWIGGVHLVGRAPAWRYDERLEVLTPG